MPARNVKYVCTGGVPNAPSEAVECPVSPGKDAVAAVGPRFADTGGEWTLTQWVHCEFVVSFEAIRLVVTQQVCGEFF